MPRPDPLLVRGPFFKAHIGSNCAPPERLGSGRDATGILPVAFPHLWRYQKVLKKLVIVFACAATAALISGCGGGGSTGEVIATFNGEEITRDEYLKQLETMDSILVVLPDGRQAQARPAQSMSTQALSKIVEKHVVLEAAKKANVLPSQNEVDQEKTLRASINPQFQDQLRAQGFSGEDIEAALRTDIALYKLTVKGQKEKTLKDAEKYVKDNPAQFRQPPTATFSWIVVSDPAVRAEVDKMLVNASFGAAAARYSVVPTAKADNGAFNSGGTPVARPVPLIDRLGEPLLGQLKKTKEGATTQWFQYQGAWAKIQVKAKTPAIDLKAKPAQLELIRRDLSRTDARGANDVQDMLLQTLMAADVKVVPAYLKKNWETLVQALKTRTMGLGETASETAPRDGAVKGK